MIRKHTRRAAKAAFAISLGVAIVLGGRPPPRRSTGRRRRRSSSATRTSPRSTSSASSTSRRSQAKGFTVKFPGSFGSSELIDTAITSGKINFYPEYTGVIVLDLAKKTSPKTAAATYAAAKKFEETRGLTLLDATPFYDTDSFGMLTSTAKKLGVKTIGDMKKVKSFSFAGYPECQHAHHLPARPEADLRADAGEVRAAREHQRLHAARPGQDHRRGRLLDRPAAGRHEVHRARRHEAHLRVPERGPDRVAEGPRGRPARSSRRP